MLSDEEKDAVMDELIERERDAQMDRLARELAPHQRKGETLLQTFHRLVRGGSAPTFSLPECHVFSRLHHAGQWTSEVCAYCGRTESAHEQAQTVQGDDDFDGMCWRPDGNRLTITSGLPREDAPATLESIARQYADQGDLLPIVAELTARAEKAEAHFTALLLQLRTLRDQWRNNRAHTYASENADLYRGFDNGQQRCADELDTVIAGAMEPTEKG